MKKILVSFLVALVLLAGTNRVTLADGTDVNLTIKNNGALIYSGNIALPPAGTISINDSDGNPHDTNADSVLSIINIADAASSEFNISKLIYYDMFGAFYLKCINVSSSELCDNWQYKVNGDSPSMGMDSKILSGGENVVLYFGDENSEPEPPAETSSSRIISSGSSAPAPVVENTILPTPLPPVPTPAPQTILPSTSINLDNKPGTIIVNPKFFKKVLVKQKSISATSDTATPSLAQPTIEKKEAPKRNWFLRFLDNLFSIF